MPDKFDAFIDRLERPLAEPVIVTMAEKCMDVQVACVKRAGAFIEQSLRMTMSANVPEGNWFSR